MVNDDNASVEKEIELVQHDLASDGIETDRNKTEKFELYLKSAENGNAIAQYNLGNCYWKGIGTDKNKIKAFEWYLESAENGRSEEHRSELQSRLHLVCRLL